MQEPSGSSEKTSSVPPLKVFPDFIGDALLGTPGKRAFPRYFARVGRVRVLPDIWCVWLLPAFSPLIENPVKDSTYQSLEKAIAAIQDEWQKHLYAKCVLKDLL